jgi:hypothetical protein
MSEQGELNPQPTPVGLVGQFDRMRIERCFGTPDLRVEFLRSMSAPEYHTMLSWVNAGVCGLSREERGFAPLNEMAPVNTPNGAPRYFGLVGPSRITMLDRSFHAAQEMQDPEHAGALIATSIVVARPFAAGNDTTAHLARDLMTRGFTGSEEDIAHYTGVLQNIEDPTVFDTVSRAGLSRRFAYPYMLHVLNEFGVPDHLRPLGVTTFVDQDMGLLRQLPAGDVRREVYDLASEPAFNRPILTEFILQSGRDLQQYLIANHQGNPLINALQLVNDIQPHERVLLWGIFEHVKTEYMQSIISCFQGDESIYGSPGLIVGQFRRTMGDYHSGPAPEPEPGPGHGTASGGDYEGPPPRHHATVHDPVLAAIHRTHLTMAPYDGDSWH